MDEDYRKWCDARRDCKAEFIGRTVRFGATIGAVLALWNGAVGGTTGHDGAASLILEGMYFLAGAASLARIQAELEWRYLMRGS